MRSPITFALTAALTLSAVAHADIKLGYVDLQRALQEVAEGKDARTRLKTELDKKKADFEGEQAKLRDDKAVLDKQGSMMSEEVRNQKFTELQKRLAKDPVKLATFTLDENRCLFFAACEEQTVCPVNVVRPSCSAGYLEREFLAAPGACPLLSCDAAWAE